MHWSTRSNVDHMYRCIACTGRFGKPYRGPGSTPIPPASTLGGAPAPFFSTTGVYFTPDVNEKAISRPMWESRGSCPS